MRGTLTMTTLALLATAGFAGAIPLPDLPTHEMLLQPVRESGDAAQTAFLEVVLIAGSQVIEGADVAQGRIDDGRALLAEQFDETQDEFAACPAGEGWETVAFPHTFSMQDPPSADPVPYAEALKERISASPDGTASGDAACRGMQIQLLLGMDLPDL